MNISSVKRKKKERKKKKTEEEDGTREQIENIIFVAVENSDFFKKK